MIEDPDRWAPRLRRAGAYNVTFHAEATDNPVAVARHPCGGARRTFGETRHPLEPYLEILRAFDLCSSCRWSPGFGGQASFPRCWQRSGLRADLSMRELTIVVEIDGGINADTIEAAAEARRGLLVAGSAVYGVQDPGAAVEALRRRRQFVAPAPVTLAGRVDAAMVLAIEASQRVKGATYPIRRWAR